ncbi:MAG TPA: DUF6638 family protein [Paracoccaceae bacterium]|nr:DUF6638 family protein [Paracoccaceae bacterium]
MKRLIEKGLMFGNLVAVTTPTMVARYNAALEKLTGRRTALADFHIDLSGFSPEVGDELGDLSYLSPEGANRMFILLSQEQARAPLINAGFSTTRPILRQFIEENAALLATLTAREAVIGELALPLWRLSRPADLLALRSLTIEADTVGGRVAEARELARMAEAFRREEELWHDDAHTEAMIALAARVGDIADQPLEARFTSHVIGNFHTSLFGGLYLFRDAPHPFLLHRDPGIGEAIPGIERLSLGDSSGVGHALQMNGLIEPLHAARGLDAAALLRERMDLVLVDRLASLPGAPDGLARLSRADLRRLARRHGPDLPPEFETIAAALAALESGRAPPIPGPADPGFFYLHRAAPGPDRDLVNELLAEFTPLDIRQLFICNKPAFYAAYAAWPEAKKDFAVEFLARDYARDKAGTRARLFGSDAVAAEPGPSLGPWGPRSRN